MCKTVLMLRVTSFLSRTLFLAVLLFTLASAAIHPSSSAQAPMNEDIIEKFIIGSKKDLNIGFRVQSAPISYEDKNSIPSLKSYRGFCNVFADELFENLKNYLRREIKRRNPSLSTSELENFVSSIKLNKDDSINFSQGGHIRRFGGLIEGQRDVECGANSIDHSLSEIDFSESFFNTGVSLLTKKTNFENILSNEEGFGNLKIGIVFETTTYTWFDRGKGYKNKQGFPSRSEAIKALKDGKIQAYASDYVLLRDILNDDVILQENYNLYPKYFQEQKYGLALKTGQSQLKSIINDTLKESSKVKKEIEFLDKNFAISTTVDPISSITSFIGKVFSNPISSFLLGLSISALVIIIIFKPIRQMAQSMFSDIFKKMWEQILPEAARWLVNLLQSLFKK